MTAPAPATEAPPAADALAVVTPTTVITQYQVLQEDIKEARAKAAEVTFDLTDKKGIAAAKSYVFSLRRLNGRIDEAHKEAKAETLERGKAIDRVKNVLREQVAALIQPHQDALDAITKAEVERVAKHRKVIDMIKDAARVPFGFTSHQIAEIHHGIGALDLSDMDEFEVEAKAAWADTIQALTAAHATAQEAEEKEDELARLREEARLQAERDAEAKRIKDEEDAAAEVARKAQAAADAAALLVIEEAEQKAAQKLVETEAALAAANRRALDAEAVADALQGEALLAIKPAEVAELREIQASLTIGSTTPPAMEISDQAVAGVRAVAQGLAWRPPASEVVVAPARVNAHALRRADVTRRNDLAAELNSALTGKNRAQVVEALLDGTFHPAVWIDWSKA